MATRHTKITLAGCGLVLLSLGVVATPGAVSAQYPAGQSFSPNVHLVSHVPLGP